MKTVPLGELCNPKQWLPLPKTAMTESGYPVYGANGRVGHASTYTHESPVIAIGCRGTIGSVHITKPYSFVTSNAMALDALETRQVEQSYLARFLAWRGLADVTSGSSQPQLTRQNLVNVSVPLPPLEEQRRIAAILDQADAVRAKRRQVLAHFDGLASSTFRRALAASPGRLMRLGEVADFFGGSSLPEGEPFAGQHGGALLMRVSDMNTVGNEQEVLSTASWAQHGSSRASTVSQGAVVLPKRGASISTNKKRLTSRPTALDPNIMGVAPRPELITSTYLFAWFQRLDLSTLVSGSSVPQLNKKDLSPLVIPVPSLEDQRAFGSVVAGLNSVRVATTRGMDGSQRLFSALQARAFRGEL